MVSAESLAGSVLFWEELLSFLQEKKINIHTEAAANGLTKIPGELFMKLDLVVLL